MQRFVPTIIRETLTFNRSSFELGPTLRCLTGVAVALGAGELSGNPTAGAILAIGAFTAGFTSLQGIYRSRIAVMAATGIGMAIASFTGELVLHSIFALVIAACIAGYLAGIFAQLSRLAGVAALNTTVAFIIFSHLPLSIIASAQQSCFLLLGSGIQIALLILVWPFSRIAMERRALAAVFRDLARFAEKAQQESAPLGSLIIAKQILRDPQPFAQSRDIARLQRLFEDATTMRKRIAGMHTFRRSLGDLEASHVTSLQQSCARTLQGIAALLEGASLESQKPVFDVATRAAFATFDKCFSGNTYAVALAQNTLVRLRDAAQAAAVFSTGTLHRFSLISAARPNQYTQAHIEWKSLVAVRLGAVLGTAMLIGHTLFSLDRGYWIALTAVLILKPDLKSTFVRGTSRIVGTIVGAVIVFFFIGPQTSHTTLALGLLSTTAICYATLLANYAVFSASVTAYVIYFLMLLGLPAQANLGSRVLDTLIGGALAMIGYLVFPTWAHKRTREILADLLEAQGRFSVFLLDGYIDPHQFNLTEFERLRTQVWKLRTDAEALVDRTRSEPQRLHSIDSSNAVNLIAGMQSLSLVNLSLENNRETVEALAPQLALMPFRNVLAIETSAISAALREHTTLSRESALSVLAKAYGREHDSVNEETRFLRIQLNAYAQSIQALRVLVTSVAASSVVTE